MLQPFAPHIAEELWDKLGGEGLVCQAPWPEFDPAKCVDDVVTMGVQINGKMRGKIELAPDAEEATALEVAKSVENISTHLDGKNIVKVIYRPGKILNLVVK